MSTLILDPPLTTEATTLPRKRFTRTDVQKMEEAGLFAGQRFELINGDLINKMGQNPPHAWAIQLCNVILVTIFGLRVRPQLPIEAGQNESEISQPEPDLAILSKDKPNVAHSVPKGHELTLAIEVADTSLTYDLTGKRDLYARASVPEYWVLDLNNRRLITHRDLNPTTATYATILAYNDIESITLEGHTITVASLLQ
jgi:Uma2 family endonuclease